MAVAYLFLSMALIWIAFRLGGKFAAFFATLLVVFPFAHDALSGPSDCERLFNGHLTSAEQDVALASDGWFDECNGIEFALSEFSLFFDYGVFPLLVAVILGFTFRLIHRNASTV